MFTGIITDIGTLVAIEGSKLTIACHYDNETIAIGASIAHDGCCLTVISRQSTEDGGCQYDVEVSEESFAKTRLGEWQIGTEINLERALRLGDEFGGHIVTGHVDGLAHIIDIEEEGISRRYKLRVPETLKKFIAPKGSVALDGVSLTVNEVEDDVFGINLIPHTLEVTNWGMKTKGDRVNIEVDLMARYAMRLAEVNAFETV